MYFLQHVDNKTYSELKPIKLTDSQKEESAQFCQIYQDAIYGAEKMKLRNCFRDWKQENDEDVATFACKLRDYSKIAFSDKKFRDLSCLMTFTSGVADEYVALSLKESIPLPESFEEAVQMARKFEAIKSMIPDQQDTVKSIMKKTAEKSDIVNPSNLSRESGERSRYHKLRHRDRSRDRRRKSRSRSLSTDDVRSQDRNRRESIFRPFSRTHLSNMGYRYSLPPKRCFFCQKIGHIQRNCWQKVKSNNRDIIENTGHLNWQVVVKKFCKIEKITMQCTLIRVKRKVLNLFN